MLSRQQHRVNDQLYQRPFFEEQDISHCWESRDTLWTESSTRAPQCAIFAPSGLCVAFSERAVTSSPLTKFGQCALIAADYKLNFTPGKGDYILALHDRVGDRLLNLFTSNGGLYIKFGGSYILAVGRDVLRHT